MEENKKTQWHPAFCSAIKLELTENKKDLDFDSEHNLNTRPIAIDLLVIKKASDVIINNEIGKIFKGHNIFEYKSHNDALNIDIFYKVIAYASLYKARGEYVDTRKADDITISFVRRRKPISLFKILRNNGVKIENVYKGIYYIKGGPLVQFDIQIIVTRELDKKEHIWLRSLTDDLAKDDVKRIINESLTFTQKDDIEYVDSVLTVVMEENYEKFNDIKEVSGMCEPLKRLMQPEIDEAVAEAVAEGRTEGRAEGKTEGKTEVTISMARKNYKRGMDATIIVQDIMEELDLSEEKAIEIYREKIAID